MGLGARVGVGVAGRGVAVTGAEVAAGPEVGLQAVSSTRDRSKSRLR